MKLQIFNKKMSDVPISTYHTILEPDHFNLTADNPPAVTADQLFVYATGRDEEVQDRMAIRWYIGVPTGRSFNHSFHVI